MTRFNQTPRFECELPPVARTQFYTPNPPPKKRPRYGTALIIAFIAAFGLFNHQWGTPGPEKPVKFNFTPPTPQAIPPAPQVPRAELIKWPWKVGQSVALMMPYHVSILARYKGVRSSTTLLPGKGNQFGDMYVVGTTPWIWLVAPGSSRAAWIDP